ncbi:glycerophosphodiester phosphodiesterase [Actinomadura livida]|uniref:Glycerophosphoryl diester phosphodiesterase n=1 Tax=Actinomadura livida TaxID=79909 RepID=A0A7W7I8G1_9ACTN|nr:MULTISPECIES: glycerophosphodiester phosphodiesterase family protein [Actinomadura]MBB4772334.1 glycerophosphoryl diester phosphodiesterase [Actinomadura catellatispora]GGU23715.1 hydrolase [Actinomadura livida]
MHRRTRRTLLAVTVSTAVIAPAAPALAAPEVPEPRPLVNFWPSKKIANVAHRGASAYAPENTLAAVRLARRQGADVFEIDVQQTKDRKLVLMHDTTLARTTNVEKVFPKRAPWRVSDFTLAEIRRLDAGSWFGARYKRERVPTLASVLRAMSGGRIGMLLEIKSPALYPGIEKRIAAALRRSPSWLRFDPSERRLAVQSFDWGSVRRFHAEMPRVPVGLLGTPKAADLPRLALFADQINPTYGSLTASYVRRVHAARMDVLTWTLNDPRQMRRAAQLGVDGIITNRPDVLHRVLRRTGARSAA